MEKKVLNILKKKILSWKAILMEKLKEENNNHEQFSEIIDSIAHQEELLLMLFQKYNFNTMLNEIQLALDKIENNTYGICEITGEKINEERLLVFPLAKYNVEIQELIDSNKFK